MAPAAMSSEERADASVKLPGDCTSVAERMILPARRRFICPRPLSPTTTTSHSFPSAVTLATMSRVPRVMKELIPPQRPLSEVIGTMRVFWGNSSYVAPSSKTGSPVRGVVHLLKASASDRRCSSPLSFAAETIFIEDVILLMFLVDWIWLKICFSVAIPRAATAWPITLGRVAHTLFAVRRRAILIFSTVEYGLRLAISRYLK
mmetsp:Transcript_2411/g.3384  ORF Transcript_2411/g.3384 Transcript_2411/m.3384 type:complete len:204 (+) Transcript_2411:533-1144(+)